MVRGRRPKPAGLKQAQGNPGKRSLKPAAADVPAEEAAATDVPAEEAGQYDPPAKLTADERRVWNQLVPMLRERRFVQDTDLRALCRYAKFAALFDAVAPKVTAKNIVKTTRSEHVVMDRLNKHFLAMLQIDKRLENLEDRFGLNPQARQAILARAAAQLPRLPLDPPQQKPQGSDAPVPPRERPRPPSPIGMGRTVN